MLVFICNSYDKGKEIASIMKRRHQFKTCAVEAEWGNQSLDESSDGVWLSLNHHKPGGIQPSMVWEINYPKIKAFILSHLDADSLFGIGWVSGFFPNTKVMKEISTIIGEIDRNGIHNVDIPNKYLNHINCIFQIVDEAKFKINKLKYKNTCNATSIIRKAINTILDIINSKIVLEKRSKYLSDLPRSKPDTILADGRIHLFNNKRVNNFKDSSHDFIVLFNRTISVFGRSDEITKKYFPEGLPDYLKTHFEMSGGHFSAAGSGRREGIEKIDFDRFLESFTDRVKRVGEKL